MAGQFSQEANLELEVSVEDQLGGMLRINSLEDMKGEWMERNRAATQTTAEASADPRAKMTMQSSFIEARGPCLSISVLPCGLSSGRQCDLG